MELGQDFNKFLKKFDNDKPVTNTEVKPADIVIEKPVAVPVQGDDSDVNEFAQGSALTCYDLGLDDDVIYSAEEGEKIAKHFGYGSVKSLQETVGAEETGVLDTATLVKLKDHLTKEKSALEEGLTKEIPAQLGVSSLAEAQKQLGVTADGKLGPETIDKVSSMLDTGDFIYNMINTKLKAQEFTAMIKVMQINLQMTDEVLKLLDQH